MNFRTFLEGGDLRSIGKANDLIALIQSQTQFDELFKLLFDSNRLIAMRAMDAIEKITTTDFSFLQKHKSEILRLCNSFAAKEIKWHLALLLGRLTLTPAETQRIHAQLTLWARDPKESKIVRVNSIQTLFDLAQRHAPYKSDFVHLIAEIEKENQPSINARIRKIKKAFQ